MPWTHRKDCADCGEEIILHDMNGKCRYEQGGWTDVKDILPAMNEAVTARRDKQVFTAMRKPDWHARSFYKRPDAFEWAIPQERDGQNQFLLVDGVTHWRRLHQWEPKVDNRGRITRK